MPCAVDLKDPGLNVSHGISMKYNYFCLLNVHYEIDTRAFF